MELILPEFYWCGNRYFSISLHCPSVGGMSAVEVHHVVTGPSDAPVVVLSNSLGSTHRMWDAQAESLAQRFRVVRYDTRGHGESPVPPGPYSIDDLADDVVALLDRLEVPRAHLVGLSLGGMTAMRVAARSVQLLAGPR